MKFASLSDLGSHVVEPSPRAQNRTESNAGALHENASPGTTACDGVSPQPEGVFDDTHLVAVQLTIGIKDDHR
jgi:hypothetical protein